MFVSVLILCIRLTRLFKIVFLFPNQKKKLDNILLNIIYCDLTRFFFQYNEALSVLWRHSISSFFQNNRQFSLQIRMTLLSYVLKLFRSFRLLSPHNRIVYCNISCNLSVCILFRKGNIV